MERNLIQYVIYSTSCVEQYTYRMQLGCIIHLIRNSCGNRDVDPNKRYILPFSLSVSQSIKNKWERKKIMQRTKLTLLCYSIYQLLCTVKMWFFFVNKSQLLLWHRSHSLSQAMEKNHKTVANQFFTVMMISPHDMSLFSHSKNYSKDLRNRF